MSFAIGLLYWICLLTWICELTVLLLSTFPCTAAKEPLWTVNLQFIRREKACFYSYSTTTCLVKAEHLLTPCLFTMFISLCECYICIITTVLRKPVWACGFGSSGCRGRLQALVNTFKKIKLISWQVISCLIKDSVHWC